LSRGEVTDLSITGVRNSRGIKEEGVFALGQGGSGHGGPSKRALETRKRSPSRKLGAGRFGDSSSGLVRREDIKLKSRGGGREAFVAT